MLDAVIQHLVVDLIGQDDKFMLACNIHNLFEQLVGVQRTCRVVRVDDNDGLGFSRNARADIFGVRHPAIVFVAQIVHRCAAGQAG